MPGVVGSTNESWATRKRPCFSIKRLPKLDKLLRIYYEDTDCGGVVYYANYLKYFERARTEYLERRGLSVAQLMEEGTVFMVVRAEAKYRSPARYGETLRIETTLDTSKNASFTFAHVIREKQSGRLVVEGSATLVPTGPDGKLKRLAAELKAALLAPPKGES